MSNPFVESRLELGIDYNSVYSIKFDTLITLRGDGSEQRRSNWSQGLISAQVGGKVVNNTELAYILDFHTQRKGSYEGFRFKDWSDYYTINNPLVSLGSNNYQLIKTYTIGSYSVKRAITKPVSGKFKLFHNGTEVTTGWTLNYTTGILTTALTGTLTASFDFDVPVRFEEDEVRFQFEAVDKATEEKLFTLQSLNLIEIRSNTTIPIDTIPQSLSNTLTLNYDLGTVGGPSFSTEIQSTESGFEDRVQNWLTSSGKWNIGERTLIKSELDYFIAFFRVCRGSAVGFSFKDWQTNTLKDVRFDADTIGFVFNAYRASDQQVIFTLGGINLKELGTPTNACIPTVVFSDANFVNWLSYSPIFFTPGNAPGSVPSTRERLVSGGNPGSCLKINTVFPNYPQGSLETGMNVFYAVFSPNAIYLPNGNLISIDFSYDIRLEELGGFTNNGLAVLQGTTIYQCSQFQEASSTSWVSQSVTASPSNFNPIGTAGNPVPQNSLPSINFSTGTPIRFGFYCINSAGLTTQTVQKIRYLDNWRVQLNIDCD